MGDDTQKSVWNFDGAELYLIFELKSKIVLSFEEWDLDDSYWKLRLLRMELDAKLKRDNKKIIEQFETKKGGKKGKTEKAIVDEMIKTVDDRHSKYQKLNDPTDEEKSNFFQQLESFYMHLCYLMKKHGLYFREGEDMSLAVLKR